MATRWRAGPPQSDELVRAIAEQLKRRGQPADIATDEPIEPPAGSERPQRPGAPASSRRGLAPVIGGVVIAVVLVGAYVVYNVTAGRPAGDQAPAERQPERAPEAKAPPVRAAVPAQPSPSDSSRPTSRPRPATPVPIDISGQWRDTTWGHVSQITQDGETFHFTVRGLACRGNFRSAGTGTIRGNRLESIYRSTTPSEGRCTGVVSADGMQIRSTCVDSVCGSFAASAVRQ